MVNFNIWCNNFTVMKKKNQERLPISFEVTGRSSEQQSTQNSYISFQTPSSRKAKQTQAYSPLGWKPGACLTIVSKSAKQERKKIFMRQEKVEKQQKVKFFQGLCSCVKREEQGDLIRVKQLKSTRKDLSNLMRQTAYDSEAQKDYTPINSLMDLLQK